MNDECDRWSKIRVQLMESMIAGGGGEERKESGRQLSNIDIITHFSKQKA